MKNLRFWVFIILTALTIPYTYGGCAGGGSGGDASDEITYSGITNPAQINETNAEDITAGAFSAGLVGDGVMGLSLDQGSTDYFIREFRTVKVPLILTDSLYQIDFTTSSVGDLQAAVHTEQDTINGNCGGSMSYSVTVNDAQGTFNGRFTFLNYCNDGTTINGRTRFDGRINTATNEFIEAHFSFDNLSGGGFTLDGDLEIDFTLSPNLITLNAYGQDTSSGKIYWIRDYSVSIDEYTGYVEIEMAGRFYHPDYGYVTLSTAAPFVLHDEDEWPTSGTLIVTGGSNSKAKISAIDNLHCNIEADVDGDDSYEWNSGTMAWDDI